MLVSIHTHCIDKHPLSAFNPHMKILSPSHKRPTQQYRQLQQQLARIGYLSQGSVFQRTALQQGSRYVWTRKLKAKTVTIALSKEQYHWLCRAVTNQRQLDRIVHRMQNLSRQVLFSTVPGVARRKRLSKKALGLI